MDTVAEVGKNFKCSATSNESNGLKDPFTLSFTQGIKEKMISRGL